MPTTREWVTICDPDDPRLRYTFDTTFLLSRWTCIYGQGCPGIVGGGTRPDLGCCTHGAYLTEDDEQDRLEESVEQLDETTMQQHDELSEGWLTADAEGEVHTRLVDGACIFLNRADFAGEQGCALHNLALRQGRDPMDTKPVVCWQVPLHRTIEEQTGNDGEIIELHTIAAYERGTWGEGGADFDWWCTEQPEAFVGEGALYQRMKRELRAMVGDAVYDELCDYLDRHALTRGRPSWEPRHDRPRQEAPRRTR